MANPLDELRKAPDAFANPYADLPHDFTLPSEQESGKDFISQEPLQPVVPGLQQARLNRFKADDLATRGIPSYTTASGDVAPITDDTGKALTGFDSTHGIAYDSKGQAKAIEYGETGPPRLVDAFSQLPTRTDLKTGAISQQGNGLYKYLGQDPVIAAANLQKEKDKAIKAESAALGRKLTLDEHDLKAGMTEHKALKSALLEQVPTLLDQKYEGADLGAVRKAIDQHFDAEYATPEANAKSGWFGGGDYTPEAQALRSDIDARKAKAHGAAEELFDLGNNLNTLSDTVDQTRAEKRAQAETLLAHLRGETGPLDEASNEAGPAPGLYPPVSEQPRMLGGEPLKPDKIMPSIGASEPVKVQTTPREQLDAPYAQGENSYRVGDDHSFHLDPNNMLKGLRQAVRDGIVDSDKAKSIAPQVHDVQDAINAQREIVDAAGGAAQVKAVAHGAGIGAAFLAGAAPGAAAGAEIGAAAGIPTGGISIAAASIVGGLIGGTLSSVAAKKLVDKLAESNDTIRSFTAAAELHPYYDAAGNLVSIGAGIPTKGAQALVGLAEKTGSKAAQSIAESYLNSAGGLWRTVSNLAEDASIRKAGGASAATIASAIGARVGGAAAVNVALDTVLNEGAKAMGIQKEGETWPKAFMAATIGTFVSAHGIKFVTRDANEMANILTRAKGAMDAGKDINTVLSPAEAESFNAFATELKRKINTGEIPIDSESVAGTVRQALQGGKNYGVAAAEVTGKGGTKGLPEGGGAKPSGGGPTSPAPETPTEGGNNQVTQPGKQVVETPAPKSPVVSKEGAGEQASPQPSGSPGTVQKTSAQATDLKAAEQAFLEQGGHADKLDAQNKLKALREAFPDPAARIKAIQERLAPASNEAETQPTAVDKAAHEAATSQENELPEPTELQKKAGNYTKGHVNVGGLDISVENPAGSRRKPEFEPLVSHYGYVKGTVGADKDHVDVFVKQGTPENYDGPVFVVNQHKANGDFDEHKAVIGPRDIAEAKAEYNANHEKGWTGGKSVVRFDNPQQFKEWATSNAPEKGTPALDPRLPKTVAKTAAELQVSYNGKDENGLHMFSDTSTPRATTFVVVPDTVASVEANALRKKVAEVRENMKGTPEQEAAFEEIKKKRAEREKQKETTKGEQESQPQPSKGGQAPSTPKPERESGPPGGAVVEKGHAGPAAKRSWSEDRVRDTLASSPAMRGAFSRGLKLKEEAIGGGGMAIEAEDSTFLVDAAAVARQENFIDNNGGDGELHLELGINEELIHLDDIRASGDRFKQIHDAIYAANKDAIHGLLVWWPQYAPWMTSAEWIRMLVQRRTGGKITEESFGPNGLKRGYDLEALYKLLDAPQPPIIDRHVKMVMNLAPDKGMANAPTPAPPPKLTKNQARRKELQDRFDALPKDVDSWKGAMPATEFTVIHTLLRDGTGAALDQAEQRIGKLEDKYATITGEQPSGAGTELPRVPPGTNVPENEGEVRKKEGGQTGGGGGAVERPPAPVEQSGVRQPQAATPTVDEAGGKALDDAFEGLFVAEARYASQVGTKGVQVSEGDVEQLRKSNEQRLRKAADLLSGSLDKNYPGWRDKHPDELPPKAQTIFRQLGKQTDMLRSASFEAGDEQQALPAEKMGAFVKAAQEMIRLGVDTPEKLAQVLESRFQGKARPFSQALWDMMGAVKPKLRGSHDWRVIYQKASNEAEKKPQSAEELSQTVAEKLRSGPLPRRELTELASETGLSVKEVDEAAEVGITMAAREIANGPGSQIESYDRLVELYQRQPNLSAKTSTSKINQAYSTPAPLAYVASRLADIVGGKSIYEPTAGNGMLLLEANPEKQTIIANELDKERWSGLRKQFAPYSLATSREDQPHSIVTQRDAAKWAPGETAAVDRVIANPPFGRVLTEEQVTNQWPLTGTTDTTHEVDHAISMRALEAMKQGGRAVLLLGGKNEKLSGAKRGFAYAQGDGGKFWKDLYDRYQVIDHFTVSGDLYSKMGAGWPVDVVTIAGKGRSPIRLPWGTPPRIISSWDELRNELGRSDEARIEAGKYNAAKDREEVSRIFDDIRGIAGSNEPPGRQGRPEPVTGGNEPAGSRERTPGSDQGQQPVAGPEPSPEAPGGGPGTVGPGTGPERPVERSVDPDSFRVPYVPQSKLKSFGIFTPTNLAAPGRAALVKLEDDVGPLDEYVRHMLGYPKTAPIEKYFSAEQMDSLALAIHAIEKGTAFVLGDQGGVGKGRVAAGMMAYAVNAGLTPIFVTKDEKLYAAMVEDLHNIGRDDIVPMFTNSAINFEDERGVTWKSPVNNRPQMKQIIEDGKLPMGIKALFTSYAQIGTDVPPGWRNSAAGKASAKGLQVDVPPGFKLQAIQKLAPNAVIIADESHLASGDSLRDHRLHDVLGKAKGIYYSSATFAKRPDSMGIYSHTSLSHATTNMSELVDAMKQGGTPLQQVVSNTLAADGLYLRRERDFAEAVFKSRINLETEERDRKLADNYTSGLRAILDISNTMADSTKKFNQVLGRLKKQYSLQYAPKLESANFSAKLHNLIKQYLFAIKAEAVVQRAIVGIKTGFTNKSGETNPHKVIISFENTMEEGPILDLKASNRPLTFNGMLLHYLDKQRVLKAQGSGGDVEPMVISDKPDPTFEHLSDEQLAGIMIDGASSDAEGNRIGNVNEAAVTELYRRIMSAVFKEAEEKIKVLELADMPLSPIDYMKRRLEAEGIKTGEITGREAGIDEDGAIYDISPKDHTKKAHLRTLREFNNTDMNALLMNASGSTGISAHSSREFKNTMPRAMLIAQPNLDINEFMQTNWRIDRTGQLHPPYYEHILTALAAELRPAAILNRKMASLNANTTSNAESEMSKGSAGTNIFNQYGDEVVHNYLRSDKDFTILLAMDKILDKNDNIYPLDAIRAMFPEDGKFATKITGRVAVLPESEARQFWDKVQADYDALIDYLNEIGENELVSDTVDLKAETLASKVLTAGRPNPTTGFDEASNLERIRAEIGQKPLPVSEVVKMMGEVDATAILDQWRKNAEEWKKKELARQIEVSINWKPEKEDALKTKWRNAEEAISNSLGMIGSGLHIKTAKGVDGYGAITAVHMDEAHPLVPSKQIFEVHINTTKRKVRIPASQLYDVARHAATDFEKVYEATAERSNERYMITGNLLAAYLAIKDSSPTAKIVNYTTAAGDLKQGILMPVKFDPGQLAARRSIDDAAHFKALLDAGRPIAGAGDVLSIVKSPSSDAYVIRVPASRIMGGVYWRDPILNKLMTDGKFTERGAAMVGKFTDANGVYKRLKELNVDLTYREQTSQLTVARFVAGVGEFGKSVKNAADEIGLTAKESLRLLQKLVSPTTGVAMDAHDQVMQMLGERNEKAYQSYKVLEASRDAFEDMPRTEQIAFIDRMKLGQPQPTPELQIVADTMRKIDTESWDAAIAAYRAIGFKEPPLKWLENHYRVLWKVIPGSNDAEQAAWIGKARRGLRGSMGQHKQHTLETMSEGLEMGGKPYSYNPVDMFLLAQADLWKLTTTLKTWKWGKDNGFVEFVRGAFPKAPEGMVALDDSIANVYFPAGSGEGLVAAGKYYVEEGFGRLLNNYLSRDFIRQTKIGRGLLWLKNATTSLELSLSAFHAVFETLESVGSNIGLGLAKLTNRGILKGDIGAAASGVKDIITSVVSPYTGFNLGREIRKAAVDPAAYFRTPAGIKMEQDYPGARQAINALWAGGWKPNELEQDWKNNSIRAFTNAVSDIKAGDSDNYIGAGLRAFPAANEMLMKPLFDHYIPNLKVAQFFKEFLEAKQQNERKLKGGVLTDAALARQVWRFVEDRFGEMNFDSLFWNRNFKTAMQLMFRSVTWKLGSVEAFAGAFAGQGKEFKDAFKEKRAPELHRNMAWLFGMFLLTATLGYIISKTLSGKSPKNLTDYVFPQIDPKDDKTRVSLPTYFKDLVHLIHSPTNYAIASMSGWIGRVADLLRNKDYFGVQIRDTDDPVVKQALQVGKFAGESLLPFSIRGYRHLSAQDVNTLRKTMALVGVTPAPRYIGQSAAERRSDEYWQGTKTEAGLRPEQFETKLEKRRMVAQLRRGESPDISGALATGTIKPTDVKPLYQRAQMGALASSILHMPLVEAEKIYAAATPKERVQLASVMAKKRAGSLKRQRKQFQGF